MISYFFLILRGLEDQSCSEPPITGGSQVCAKSARIIVFGLFCYSLLVSFLVNLYSM